MSSTTPENIAQADSFVNVVAEEELVRIQRSAAQNPFEDSSAMSIRRSDSPHFTLAYWW